ncbi:HBS1-like protein [Lentinula edodes]|uniref:HBS1-like protein n=1 Tax=Lentinula edodes TaxID=5353 RepID=A0A1Q3DWR1_LENED|nr:HBS1-like protein [Lentinula edodes]
MSRHRYVKNLNIADELDDDALSDGVDEEEMTAEQQLRMNDVLEEIRNLIGEEEISGLPDSEIKDTIWYYNFDISESIQWCLDQQEKRRAAKERQGEVLSRSLSLPPPPFLVVPALLLYSVSWSTQKIMRRTG